MPVTTYTLSGDFSALVGEVSQLRATIHANGADDSWINETDLKVILGGALLAVNEAGVFTATLPTSTGTGLQYEVRVSYRDNATKTPKTWQSGWFNLTANGNLATLANDSSLRVNPSQATILGGRIDDAEDRLEALEAGGGTEALADRVDGVNDHGDVSGTLLLNPAKGFHVFDATGPTTVEIGNPPGRSIAFQAVTGADDVTVEGLDDLELTDGAWASFVYFRDAWHLASAGASGGGTVEPVNDPPTQPGTVTVTPTNDGYTLSWGASTVAAGYEVQIDGGTWVDSGTDTTHTYTGLASGSSHSGAVRAYNSLGERSSTRTWGPVNVNTVGLHEQLMSYEPELYVRMSQGSRQVYDFDTSGVWDQFAPGTITYTGPALVPGATGSALFSGGNIQLYRENFGATLANTTTMTIVATVKWPATSSAGVMDVVRLSTETGANPFNAKSTANVEGGSAGYEATSLGGEHQFVWRKQAGGTKFQIFRDGTFLMDGADWTNLSEPLTRFYVRRSSTDFIISELAIMTTALTNAEILALAQAADVVGNPR